MPDDLFGQFFGVQTLGSKVWTTLELFKELQGTDINDPPT